VKRALTIAAAMLSAWSAHAQPASQPSNEIVGTWRMISARLFDNGRETLPYGPRPAGMLVFTPDMHFVEVLTDPSVPRFASDQRGRGTDAENRRAMAGSIGFFGTYSVDDKGRFSGNRVEGSTFSNWVGGVRTTRELTMVVEGDRLFETFTRPDGGRLRAEFRRAR
jgi:hypothetical protein